MQEWRWYVVVWDKTIEASQDDSYGQKKFWESVCFDVVFPQHEPKFDVSTTLLCLHDREKHENQLHPHVVTANQWILQSTKLT